MTMLQDIVPFPSQNGLSTMVAQEDNVVSVNDFPKAVCLAQSEWASGWPSPEIKKINIIQSSKEYKANLCYIMIQSKY